MDDNPKPIITLIAYLFLGLVILSILTPAFTFIIFYIWEIFSPSPKPPYPEGLGVIRISPTVGRLLISIVISYLTSLGVASFISGFFLRRSETKTFVWQSLITGFIIGVVVPMLLIATTSNERHSIIQHVIWVIIFGAVTALVALTGYYIADRRNTNKMPKEG